MDMIIVTITNDRKSFFFDIEIPVSINVGKLKADLHEALNAYKPDLFIKPPDAIRLCCTRLNKELDNDSSLESAGVWNGDYITITEE